MPASSLFAAEMDRPTPTPSHHLTSSSSSMDEQTLQLALELSLLGLNNDAVNQSDDAFLVSGLDADRVSKRSQNMTECVAVPSSEHVAEIVGRQGCKIKALRAKTNTYIKTPVRGEEPVFVVTGRKEDVAMAKREILSAAEHFSQIRACRKNNLNGSMAPGPPTNIPGQVTIQVRVPYRVVGLVVGPKGATIKRIQQQTHTYIVTPSRDKEPVFEVTGLPESVDQARKEIEAHIAMRTGGLVDQEEAGSAVHAAAAAAAAVAAANGRHDFSGTNSLDNLFGSSDFVSSIYKLNNSPVNGLGNGMGISNGTSSLNSLNGLSSSSTLNGLGSLNGLNTLNGLNNLNSNIGSGLNSTLPSLSGLSNGSLNNTINNLGSLNELNFSLLGETSSSLLNSKSGLDTSSLFSLANGGSSSKMMDVNGQGLGSLYSVDEGLGSLGSSMGSSPSFDPAPSSIWGDLGRSISTSLNSGVNSSGSLSSTLSSISSSLTRRSSSVSGASPPSRLSPTLDNHPPARRISSDPVSAMNPSLASITNALTGGLGGLPASSTSASSSPSSTPELAMPSAFTAVPPSTAISSIVSSTAASNVSSASSSPTLVSLSDSCGSNSSVSRSEKRCRTCGEATVVAALVPCGHNLFCMDCANKLVGEESDCPICRVKVNQAIRILNFS